MTFLFCVVSALFPLVNAETYLVGLELATDGPSLWLTALAAGAGQTVGKTIWFEAGRRSLRWKWVRRRLDTPRAQRTQGRWQHVVESRPALSALLLFSSAVVGLPPLLVVAVIAGHLQQSRLAFVVIVCIGRTLRFAAVLGGTGWLVELLQWGA